MFQQMLQFEWHQVQTTNATEKKAKSPNKKPV